MGASNSVKNIKARQNNKGAVLKTQVKGEKRRHDKKAGLQKKACR